MATNFIKTRIKNKISSQSSWETTQLSSLVLLDGEIAFVRGINNEMTALKVGDGSSQFSDLPYVGTPDLSGKQDILVATRAEWQGPELSGFRPKSGQIVIWSDKGSILTTDNEGNEISVDVPGFKVGDGNAHNIDLPFSGDDMYAALTAMLEKHASSDTHLSSGERARWDHKITLGSITDPNDDGVEGETLIITRN